MKGRYTLYYSPSVPAGETYEKQADSVVDALSTAWLTQQEGGTPSSIAYDNQVILNGEDLQQILSLISRRSPQPGAAPNEIVEQLIPEVLAEQLAKSEQYAGEYFGATAVYRDLLEELYEDEVEKRLVEQGIISIGAPLSAERASAQEFKPIQVTGKPISEMIIEERR